MNNIPISELKELIKDAVELAEHLKHRPQMEGATHFIEFARDFKGDQSQSKIIPMEKFPMCFMTFPAEQKRRIGETLFVWSIKFKKKQYIKEFEEAGLIDTIFP